MKEICDILFSFLLLCLLSPLFLLIIILIYVTSKGPVFFKQRRIGKDKKEFFIYKFRTMYINAPENVPTHLLDDPKHYITPVGRFLRRTSLDELPQLYNILRGDMSFVGPRPALYNQYDLINLRDQYNVNGLKPGLTGWAQINGRDELPIEIKAQYDKYYVEHCSLGLDFKILLKTITSVISARGIAEGRKS